MVNVELLGVLRRWNACEIGPDEIEQEIRNCLTEKAKPEGIRAGSAHIPIGSPVYHSSQGPVGKSGPPGFNGTNGPSGLCSACGMNTLGQFRLASPSLSDYLSVYNHHFSRVYQLGMIGPSTHEAVCNVIPSPVGPGGHPGANVNFYPISP